MGSVRERTAVSNELQIERSSKARHFVREGRKIFLAGNISFQLYTRAVASIQRRLEGSLLPTRRYNYQSLDWNYNNRRNQIPARRFGLASASTSLYSRFVQTLCNCRRHLELCYFRDGKMVRPRHRLAKDTTPLSKARHCTTG